jgi:adenosylcobyric acid synthase
MRDAVGSIVGWQQGCVLGTYAHGLFENTAVCRVVCGAEPQGGHDIMFDLLADAVDKHFDPIFLKRILEEQS